MANTNATDARTQPFGGVINEDLMQKIWNISDFPLAFTDQISKGTHSNQRTEWTESELGPVSTANAHVDGTQRDIADQLFR